MTVTALDSSSALVIIDLQNAIINAPTVPYTGSEVVARAVELARAFHEHSAPVVRTGHGPGGWIGCRTRPQRNPEPARSLAPRLGCHRR
ncbi:isochorismatase family protein [Nocardia sp. NPDC059091]|uniref:isochorismatase family protein n=1 Tax=unclassified Nocardia TaxID=2637762 RepID=UPI00367F624A